MDEPGLYDYCPWMYWRAPEDVRVAHTAHLSALSTRLSAAGAEIDFGEQVYISPLAAVFTDRLRMGRKCYLAAHAYLTHDVEMGDDCTVNPFATVRGRIRLGHGVRIGAHTSLLGFNHGTAPDRPVYRQPTTSVGITVGNDVWIGSHVVVLDGVTIGDHCVIGAGAVVTKDLPDWAVAAGNPARVLRDRRQPRSGTDQATTQASAAVLMEQADLAARLERFADRARSQAANVLDRCWQHPASGAGQGMADTAAFVAYPGAARTVRAWCDAVEIADLLLGSSPPQLSGEEIGAHLRSLQDPETGLVPEYGERQPDLHHGGGSYHILCVGYALQLLGSRFEHPIHAVHDLPAEDLRERLDALPWHHQAWSSGSFVDAIGTAYYRNQADFGLRAGSAEFLFGWLLAKADPSHGMWGTPDNQNRLHQIVNGFYRLTRGTYGQFGLPLPYPERAIDTLLAHARDTAYFGPSRGTACDVLDVIHPLWLCAKQTGYRRREGEEWARAQLDRVLPRWQDGAGFSFSLESGPGWMHVPGLQGTEMWLAIIWYLADYLGQSQALGYRPAGVHRPSPATTW